MTYRDEVMAYGSDYIRLDRAAEIAARADARIAELERDAARYRWLRECDIAGDRAVHNGDELREGDSLDAAIDAARAGNGGEG